MKKEIIVTIKTPYGHTLFCPEDEEGKLICNILGTKTLGMSAIKHLLKIGFKIRYKGDLCEVLEELGIERV